VSRKGHRVVPEILASVALLFLFANFISAQNGSASSAPPYNSLFEIADKSRVLLLVRRTSVVDVSGKSNSMIEEVLKSDPRQSRRYRLAYNTIAGKLNKYMKKYKSISAVGRIEEADYIIFFNLLEYRWPLGYPYPYGELFVIVNSEAGGGSGPRIVWKSKKVQWAGDAADDLLDDLRSLQKPR
jgi:hypothetical protein